MSFSSPKVILIVDDNADARMSLGILLRLVGFAVDTASDGQSALEYLRDHLPPSLIVLDLRMPGMGGLQFLDIRRGQPLLSAIPVIVCSGEPEWTVGEFLDGAAFHQKGADPMSLIEAVRAICDRAPPPLTSTLTD